MSFHEVLFPTDISYGSKGGPTYNTKIITMVSGQEQRIPRWSAPRFRYDVAEKVKAVSAWAALATFYIARQGPANGFRFKDWTHFSSASDHRSAPTNLDQVIGTGDGVTQTFQLRKGYTSGSSPTIWKNIYKPVDLTTVAAINSSGTSAFTVNLTNGIITFTSAPANASVITAGFQFDMPVRFGDELDQNFLFNYEEYDVGSIDTLTILEDLNPISADEDFYYGGGTQFLSMSAAVSISALTGRAIQFAPTAALDVFLPSPVGYPLGGPHWVLYNSGSFTLTFKTGSTTWFTLTTTQKVTVYNMPVSGVNTWIAF